jgi:CYTH domain-containing protein
MNLEIERKFFITKLNVELQTQGLDFNLENRYYLYRNQEGYALSENPKLELKIYGGKFEGLARAEVEFNNIEEGKNFLKPEWFGDEITDSAVGMDTLLPDLGTQEFLEIIKSLNK